MTGRQFPPALESRMANARELIASRRVDEARAVLLGALRDFPYTAQAIALLAELEKHAGRLGHARFALERALDFLPRDEALWSRLGAVNATLGRWDEAMRAYARAANLEPHSVCHLAALALAQMADQRASAAEGSRQQLLTRFPLEWLTHLVSGHVLKTQGRLDEALTAYTRAEQLHPDSSEALFNLVDIRAPSPADALTSRLSSLAADPQTAVDDRANYAFALARIFDRARSFDDAFLWYRQANDAHLQGMLLRNVAYDRKAAERKLAATVAEYRSPDPERILPGPPLPFRPVFIVGMPRSGTSLVEQILSRHSQVSAGGELTAAPHCLRVYHQQIAMRNISEQQALLEARERYVEAALDRGCGAPFVTDKLPANFELLGFIRRMLPNAVLIHCRRNPIATCFSLYCANFSSHAPYCSSLDDLAHQHALYRSFMDHWYNLLHPPIVDVQYENLVSDPEPHIRQLLRACGLAFETACLSPQESERAVVTASALQVRRPIYRFSINHWKHYERHLAVLAPLVTARDPQPAPVPPRR